MLTDMKCIMNIIGLQEKLMMLNLPNYNFISFRPNLILKKVWADESLFIIQIEVISQYVHAYQNCYFDDS